jgi:acyl-coenzyme A synthetase/AMP-(fatty) acid ligase
VNIGEQVEWHSIQAPQSAALSIPGPYRDTVSYFRLNAMIQIAGQRLVEAGAAPSRSYGLWVQDTLLHIVLLLALERLGAISVSLTSVESAVALSLDAVLSDQDTIGKDDWIRVDLGWLSGEPTFRFPRRTLASGDVCRIIMTSGTTGTQKGVAITRHMLADRLNSYRYVFGEVFANHSRILCCMGLASSIGYLFLMHALSRGGLYCVPEPVIELTVRRASFYGVQSVMASPVTLAEFAPYADTGAISWPALELVLTAGSSLPAALADYIRRSMCNRLVSFYGTTEVGVIATGPADTLDLARGEVGPIVPGIEVAVDNPDAAGIGRIRVRGDGNASAYLGDASSGTSAFENGWFVPGDLGAVSDNFLRIAGRADNVVNLGGVKSTLESVDQQFTGAPGVRELATVLWSDPLGVPRIICAIVPAAEWSDAQFSKFCTEQVRQTYQPARIVLVERLPRTSSGKLDRRQLATEVEQQSRTV